MKFTLDLLRLAALSSVLACGVMALSGCSVVNINGSLRTEDSSICVVEPLLVNPEVQGPLVQLLGKKGFRVRILPHGTKPSACRQTLVYGWAREQYYVPAYVKQYAINLDLYVEGEKHANASFDPARNLVSAHVRYIRFTRYLGRLLDRLFPGRTLVGA